MYTPIRIYLGNYFSYDGLKSSSEYDLLHGKAWFFMGQTNSKDLNKKLDKLKKYIFADKSMDEFQREIEGNLTKDSQGTCFAVFVSVCNTRERAHVCHGTGYSLNEAWDNAINSTITWVRINRMDAQWIKIDIVKNATMAPVNVVVNMMFESYNEFFRRGVSLDPNYKYSFTEAELNGNRLITYKEKCFDLRLVNKYLMARDNDVMLSMPRNLIYFDCYQYFCDEKDELYTLYTEGLDVGRRVTDVLDKRKIMYVINSGAKFLTEQIHDDGSFDYGYYPIFHKLIPGYNILRHASTIWSMICAAELNHNREIYQKALRAIKYMCDNIEHYPDGCAYLIEKTKNEIKLGGNAVVVILLTQYMKLYQTDEFTDLCVELGEGILKMFNSENGTFVHVLNYPERDLKEEYRTVYYDGEATFALARLYSLTKDKKWLDAAQKSVDHFIAANYIKYRDHWVAYAVNELTMYIPEEKYFEFGLKNVQKNMNIIYKQETSYHTYLELLTATFDMYMRIRKEGHQVKYMEEFDEVRFIETIFHRGHHMLNGFGYPEFVMYFKKPCYFRGAFFVRHDGYRTRIDDVQHFAGAYISLYKHYEELQDRYRELTGKEIS